MLISCDQQSAVDSRGLAAILGTVAVVALSFCKKHTLGHAGCFSAVPPQSSVVSLKLALLSRLNQNIFVSIDSNYTHTHEKYILDFNSLLTF